MVEENVEVEVEVEVILMEESRARKDAGAFSLGSRFHGVTMLQASSSRIFPKRSSEQAPVPPMYDPPRI
jgi:hypothetical protein